MSKGVPIYRLLYLSHHRLSYRLLMQHAMKCYVSPGQPELFKHFLDVKVTQTHLILIFHF